MRILSLLFVAFTFLSSAAVHASLITVNDGDQFNYDENDTYQFTGALSGSNPILTYGVNVDPGEIMSFVVNAPAEFDLQAAITTGPDASGTVILHTNGNGTIPLGTSYDFPIDGFVVPGITKWLSIGIDSEAITIIDNMYGGAFEVSSFTETGPYGQSGGGSTGGGSSGGNTGGSVPEPGTLLLFSAALLGLAGTRRKNIKDKGDATL